MKSLSFPQVQTPPLHLLWTGRHSCSSGPNQIPKNTESASRPGDESTNLLHAVTADAGKYPATIARVSPERRGLNRIIGEFQTQPHAAPSGLRLGRGTVRKIHLAAPSTSLSNGTTPKGNCVRRWAFVLTRRWCDESAPRHRHSDLPSDFTSSYLHYYNFIPISTSTSAPCREPHN